MFGLTPVCHCLEIEELLLPITLTGASTWRAGRSSSLSPTSILWRGLRDGAGDELTVEEPVGGGAESPESPESPDASEAPEAPVAEG